MSIRTSLILSYLALVFLLTFGMLAGADWIGERLRRKNLAFTENAVQKITAANLNLSEDVLKKYGEFSVVDIAEAIARELSYLLASRKSYSYAAMRQDPTLRRVAVQDIFTPDGVAGYTDLLDIYGVSVLHPNPTVEGKNFVMWADEFPENQGSAQKHTKYGRKKGKGVQETDGVTVNQFEPGQVAKEGDDDALIKQGKDAKPGKGGEGRIF